jgi:hypothetical protein
MELYLLEQRVAELEKLLESLEVPEELAGVKTKLEEFKKNSEMRRELAEVSRSPFMRPGRPTPAQEVQE